MRLSDRDMVKAVRAFAGIGFRICDRCQSIYRPGNEGYTSDYIKLCDECLKEAGAIRVESLTRELMYALKQHEKWENATLAKARRLLGDMDA